MHQREGAFDAPQNCVLIWDQILTRRAEHKARLLATIARSLLPEESDESVADRLLVELQSEYLFDSK